MAVYDPVLDLPTLPTQRGVPVRLAALVATALLVVGGGAYWWLNNRRAPTPTYTALPVQRGDVSTGVSATGPLVAAWTAPLGFKNPGQVTEIMVEPGQRVTRGGVLARQNDADVRRSLDQARATLDQQQANLAKLEQAASPEQLDVARAQVKAATVAVADAGRNTALAEQSAQADVALARTTLENARNAGADAQATSDAQQALGEASGQADMDAVAAAQSAFERAQQAVKNVQAQADQQAAADQTAVDNASTTLEEAKRNLQTVVAQSEASSQLDGTAEANAVQALASAQQNLRRAQAVLGNAEGVGRAQNDKADRDVSVAHANRDAICSDRMHNTHAQCVAAQGLVDQADAVGAVTRAQGNQTRAQLLQSIAQAQAQVDQATGALQSVRDQQASNAARSQQLVTQAQAQVEQASGALRTAQDTQRTNGVRSTGLVQNAQSLAEQAQAAVRTAQDQQASGEAHNGQILAQARQTVNQATSVEAAAGDQMAQARVRAALSVQTAHSQLDQARTQVETSQAQFAALAAGPTSADLAAAQAQVRAAGIAVEQAQANLDAATLVAPRDATVAQVNVAPGQFVAGGGTPGAAGSAPSPTTGGVVTLADMSTQLIQAQVNEADMANVRPGAPISFTVAALPGQTFTGRVQTIQPLGSNSSNVVTYAVNCSVDATDQPLLPGMTAAVTLITNRRQDVVVIPQAALQFAQSQGAAAAPSSDAPRQADRRPATVMVLQAGNPVPRQIQLGLSDGRMTEVVDGLSPGELVITSASCSECS